MRIIDRDAYNQEFYIDHLLRKHQQTFQMYSDNLLLSAHCLLRIAHVTRSATGSSCVFY